MLSPTLAPPADARRDRSLLRELDGGSPVAFIGPNWFASVMGTGIVAVAAATLPVRIPGLLPAARVVWSLDAVLLAVVVVVSGLALLPGPLPGPVWAAGLAGLVGALVLVFRALPSDPPEDDDGAVV